MYDSNNALVGTLLAQNTLVMKLGGQSLIFNNFQNSGFSVTNSSSVVFYYTSVNCTGQRYLPASDLPRTAILDKSLIVYYPDDPVQGLEIASIETFAPDQSVSTSGQCSPLTPTQSLSVGPAVSMPLPAFTAPFHL